MKTKKKTSLQGRAKRDNRTSGFTNLQMVITVAFMAIFTSMALFGINSARASVRLTGSTRELAGYLEKARSNAVRRNGTSVVTIVNTNSYSVTMDFDNDGATETRTISLQNGVTFPSNMVGITATFDWRGRVASQIGFTLTNDHGVTASINLSGSGDVTLGEIFPDSAIADVTLNSTPSTTVASGTPSSSPSSSPTPSPA